MAEAGAARRADPEHVEVGLLGRVMPPACLSKGRPSVVPEWACSSVGPTGHAFMCLKLGLPEKTAGLQWVDAGRPSLDRDWVVRRRAGSVG